MMPLVSAWRRPASREALILLLAVAAFVMAVAPALRETGTPPGWDQSVHLRDSLVYERILRHPSVLAGGVLGAILHGSEDFPLLTPSGYYPPLVPGITPLVPRGRPLLRDGDGDADPVPGSPGVRHLGSGKSTPWGAGRARGRADAFGRARNPAECRGIHARSSPDGDGGRVGVGPARQ